MNKCSINFMNETVTNPINSSFMRSEYVRFKNIEKNFPPKQLTNQACIYTMKKKSIAHLELKTHY